MAPDGPAIDPLITDAYGAFLVAYASKLNLKELRRIEKLPDLFDVDSGTDQDLLAFHDSLAQFRKYLVELGQDKPETYQQLRGVLRQRIVALELAQEKLDRAIRGTTTVRRKQSDPMLELVVSTYESLITQLAPGMNPSILRKMAASGNPFELPPENQTQMAGLHKRLGEFKGMAGNRADPAVIREVLLEELERLAQ